MSVYCVYVDIFSVNSQSWLYQSGSSTGQEYIQLSSENISLKHLYTFIFLLLLLLVQAIH